MNSAQRPARAEVRLVAPRAASERNESVEDRLSLLLLKIQAMLSADDGGNVDERHAIFDELMGLKSGEFNSVAVHCLLALAEVFYMECSTPLGLASADRAVQIAHFLSDRLLIRRALSVKGLMLNESGNLPAAMEALAEALNIARVIADPGAEAAVWINLGNTLTSSGQYSDGFGCFLRAEDLVRDSGSATESFALVNLSGCAQYLRDPRKGIAAAKRAIEINTRPSTGVEVLSRILAESNLSRLLVLVGDVAEAARHCEEAKGFLSRSRSPRTEYTYEVVQGLVDVHSGQISQGLARLQNALEIARKSVASEIGDALSACVGGYEAAGRPDAALVYLHQLLALNHHVKSARLIEPFQRIKAKVSVDGRSRDFVLAGGRAAKLHLALGKHLLQLETTVINAVLAAGHDKNRIFRLGKLARVFVQAEGWGADRTLDLELAARLCDLGMMMVPNPILRKAGKLSLGERRIVDDHTRIGAELLVQTRLSILQQCVAVAQFHHERWDGSGPCALNGDAIPIEARVVALCDAFDSMTHPRPWRRALSAPAAINLISSGIGVQFDPVLTPRFIDFIQSEFWKHEDWEAFLGSDAKGNAYVQSRERLSSLMKRRGSPDGEHLED